MTESEALQRILTHEAVCTERYQQIHKTLENIQRDIHDIKVDRKASESMLRDEMQTADDAIRLDVRTNKEEINKINLKIAYFVGAGAVGSFLGTALFQLLSGALTQ